MEIGASLASLELTASSPEALAGFYSKTFCLDVSQDGETLLCRAPGRELRFRPGTGGELYRATFAFHTIDALKAHRARLQAAAVALVEEQDDHYSVADPDGRLFTFRAPQRADDANRAEPQQQQRLNARLQHFALRTPSVASLLGFFVDRLGFLLSDRVLDDNGELGAAFLRTDHEHHTLALFRAPASRFDHFSCETTDWPHLRDWADHMASTETDLAWGIGRHGPGNDSFLMVRDPDGNMGEISCDLEVVASDRPTGVWRHRPQTLNRYGIAIMRD